MKRLLFFALLFVSTFASAQQLTIKTSQDIWYVQDLRLYSFMGFDSTFATLGQLANFLEDKTFEQSRLTNWYVLGILKNNTKLLSPFRDPIGVELTNPNTGHLFKVETNQIDSILVNNEKVYMHWYQ